MYSFNLMVNIFTILLIVKLVIGNYAGRKDSIQLERSNENLLDSNVEDANSMNDYSSELSSQNRHKNKEWVTVSMGQESYSLIIGQSYELKCDASGSPAPEIHWFRGIDIQRQINKLKHSSRLNIQGVNMAKVHSKYIINCVTEADAGPIHCVAVSGQTINKKTAIIQADESLVRTGSCDTAHSPVITNFKRTLLSLQGSTIILPCEVSGDPKPQTYWQIDDDGAMIVENDSRIGLLRDGGLMIKSLEWSDIGAYTCIANSTLGEDRSTTFVYPLRPAI